MKFRVEVACKDFVTSAIVEFDEDGRPNTDFRFGAVPDQLLAGPVTVRWLPLDEEAAAAVAAKDPRLALMGVVIQKEVGEL